ncbi:MAG: right-handed parallel beta-helix repeat-containing protein [Candidatus Saccharibacteria bacterium]|nr:right-handed parallel beta-helix repeat-containing protein [Candidatus Saccharibacteria bacterium]
MVYNYYQGVVRERISKLALLTIALLFSLTAAIGVFSSAGASDHCQTTPAGTANYVNEVPNNAFTVTCEIGIYFDQNGTINRAQVEGATDSAMSTQYGIYVDGAKVDVRNSSVTVEEDYANRFVGVTYQDGASGAVRNSELTGALRAAVVVRGANTDVSVQKNLIAGTGAKTSGWAENGVQVDQGATASIKNNQIEGFWWDGESNWASTAIMLFADKSSVVNNDVKDSEFAFYVSGDKNKVKGNTTNSTVVSSVFSAYGILVSGEKNHIAGNKLTSDDGAVGVYFFPGSEKNRLTGNRVSGFAYPVYDGGDNVVRGLVTPVQ